MSSANLSSHKGDQTILLLLPLLLKKSVESVHLTFGFVMQLLLLSYYTYRLGLRHSSKQAIIGRAIVVNAIDKICDLNNHNRCYLQGTFVVNLIYLYEHSNLLILLVYIFKI